MKETIKSIPINELHPFPENPFSVREDTELQDSIRDYGIISQLEKSRTAAEQRIKGLLDYKRDETLTFEEMGIDALFVDEAHNFKDV